MAATKCNFQEHLDVTLRNRLVAEFNWPKLQRKLLSEKDTSFQNLRIVRETTEGLNNSIQVPLVLLKQPYTKPLQSQDRRHASKRKPKAKTCNSCGVHHPLEEYKFRQAVCYKCQKKGHIRKVFRIQTLLLSSTSERELDESLVLKTLSVPTRSHSSFDKPSCDPRNVAVSRVLCGNIIKTNGRG